MSQLNKSSRPKRIFIQEVVTRDGFQAERVIIPTEEKIALINRLGRGVHRLNSQSERCRARDRG